MPIYAYIVRVCGIVQCCVLRSVPHVFGRGDLERSPFATLKQLPLSDILAVRWCVEGGGGDGGGDGGDGGEGDGVVDATLFSLVEPRASGTKKCHKSAYGHYGHLCGTMD